MSRSFAVIFLDSIELSWLSILRDVPVSVRILRENTFADARHSLVFAAEAALGRREKSKNPCWLLEQISELTFSPNQTSIYIISNHEVKNKGHPAFINSHARIRFRQRLSATKPRGRQPLISSIYHALRDCHNNAPKIMFPVRLSQNPGDFAFAFSMQFNLPWPASRSGSAISSVETTARDTESKTEQKCQRWRETILGIEAGGKFPRSQSQILSNMPSFPLQSIFYHLGVFGLLESCLWEEGPDVLSRSICENFLRLQKAESDNDDSNVHEKSWLSITIQFLRSGVENIETLRFPSDSRPRNRKPRENTSFAMLPFMEIEAVARFSRTPCLKRLWMIKSPGQGPTSLSFSISTLRWSSPHWGQCCSAISSSNSMTILNLPPFCSTSSGCSITFSTNYTGLLSLIFSRQEPANTRIKWWSSWSPDDADFAGHSRVSTALRWGRRPI